MNKINLLDPKVFNRISAGEVVERPSSIVKELVENSIDANAKNIVIEIEDGGKKNITISDDGTGIAKEDLPLAFLPHATSKIKTVDDLDNIISLGFRGEALASISSVCQVKISSKTSDSDFGYSLNIDGGVAGQLIQVARTNGTTISCSNLFFNTPVRAKFLKKSKIEESEITHLVEKFMLCRSDICFKYFIDGKMIYNTTCCNMQDIIYTIYGKEVYESILPINFSEDNIKLYGFVSKPSYSRSNRSFQLFFVNKRYIENYIVSSAVQSVFENFLMKGKFPFYVLCMEIPSDSVDVNVHPSKKEVKFENPNKIFSIVRKAIENALLNDDQVNKFLFSETTKLTSSSNNPQSHIDFEIAKKSLFEKSLTSDEGFSFKNKQNCVDLINKEVEINNDFQTEKVINSDLPDFANIKLPEKEIPDNSKNNVVFFDQDQTEFLNEIKNNTKFENQKFLTANVREEMKVLGTIFKTYIAIEFNDNLYFIDQHAAHERLLYDKLIAQIDDNKLITQDLLIPFSFSINNKEAQFVSQIESQINSLGFNLKISDNKITIYSVPAVLSNISLDEFAEEIVKEGLNWDKKRSDFIHDKLCQTACKHAIKAGDSITLDECAFIIENVRKGVMLCPHGRPITLVISKTEFEKMFKRII